MLVLQKLKARVTEIGLNRCELRSVFKGEIEYLIAFPIPALSRVAPVKLFSSVLPCTVARPPLPRASRFSRTFWFCLGLVRENTGVLAALARPSGERRELHSDMETSGEVSRDGRSNPYRLARIVGG